MIHVTKSGIVKTVCYMLCNKYYLTIHLFYFVLLVLPKDDN